MCGRFGLDGNLSKKIKTQLKINFFFAENMDIRPTNSVATLVNIEGELSQLNCAWGIKPSWSKKLLINAQAETAAEKRTFKKSFLDNRCVVPVTCWYEWADEGNQKKTKYQFSAAENNILYLAGIYFQSDNQQQLVTLTTSPTELCSKIHNRMPLLITQPNINAWLDSFEYAQHLSQESLLDKNYPLDINSI